MTHSPPHPANICPRRPSSPLQTLGPPNDTGVCTQNSLENPLFMHCEKLKPSRCGEPITWAARAQHRTMERRITSVLIPLPIYNSLRFSWPGVVWTVCVPCTIVGKRRSITENPPRNVLDEVDHRWGGTRGRWLNPTHPPTRIRMSSSPVLPFTGDRAIDHRFITLARETLALDVFATT